MMVGIECMGASQRHWWQITADRARSPARTYKHGRNSGGDGGDFRGQRDEGRGTSAPSMKPCRRAASPGVREAATACVAVAPPGGVLAPRRAESPLSPPKCRRCLAPWGVLDPGELQAGAGG